MIFIIVDVTKKMNEPFSYPTSITLKIIQEMSISHISIKLKIIFPTIEHTRYYSRDVSYISIKL